MILEGSRHILGWAPNAMLKVLGILKYLTEQLFQLSPCIMCVQYIGGVQYIRGIS